MSVRKSWWVFSSETFLLLHQTHVFIDSSIIFSHSEKRSTENMDKNANHAVQAHTVFIKHLLHSVGTQYGADTGPRS